MPRHPRPRRLSDADLTLALVDALVCWLLGDGGGDAWTEAIYREARRRGLMGKGHRPSCVCADCVQDWIEGIHDDPTGPF